MILHSPDPETLNHLTLLLENDAEKRSSNFRSHGMAVVCLNCRTKTRIGLRPFWHRFARLLCPDCGQLYIELLCRLNAFDKF